MMPADPRATMDTPSDDDGLWTPVVAVASRYEVVGEIGRGGLGRVYAAHDRVLKRPVAIKELVSDAPGHRERFRREILLTARLQHPAIVSLYEVVAGDDGVDRYAMKLVTGTTLDVAAAEAGGLEGRLGLLRHVVTVADAVAYAHAQGVIHRDIKPANILVGEFGEAVLIDWGIAKDLGATEEVVDAEATGGHALTRVGAVIGTPAYMAPEQARGEPADVRSDVYALGATLWHVLAGGPPYGQDADATISLLREGRAPGDLSRRALGIPADLAAIVARAMAPQRADRYPDALALSRDLQRFMTGQLVEARSYTLMDLVRRFVRQHRALVGLGAVATLALVGMGAWSARRVVAERNAAEAARALAEERADALVLTHAEAVVEGDPTEAAAWLAQYPRRGREPDRALLVAQDAVSAGVARVAVRWSPDGCDRVVWDAVSARLYPAGIGVAVADAATGAPLGETGRIDLAVALPQGGAVTARDAGALSRVGSEGGFTPLGQVSAQPRVLAASARSVLVGDAAGALTEVRLEGGATRTVREGQGGVVAVVIVGSRWVAAWPDGVWEGGLDGGAPRRLDDGAAALAVARDRVIVGREDGVVRAIDAAGATSPLMRLPEAVDQLAASADGRWVAAADVDHTTRVVDLASGEVLAPPWSDVRAHALSWSPADAVLAATLADGTTRLWRPPVAEATTWRSGSGLLRAAAFSPDGRQAAVCSVDGSLRVWDVPAMTARTRTGHTDRVFHVASLGDGRFASDSDDLTVRLWSSDGRAEGVLRGHTDRVYGLEVAPDRRRLVSAGVDGVAWVWSVTGGQGVPLRGHDGRVHRAVFASNDTVLTAGRDGTLRSWSVDGRPLSAVAAHTGAAWWVEPDGDVAWSVGADRALRRWRWGSAEPPELVADALGPVGGETLRALRTGPGEVVLCDGTPKGLMVVGPAGTRRYVLPVAPMCPSLAVSPDGSRVAVPAGSEVGLLDLRSGRYETLARLHGDVHAVAFSPDGALVATAVLDGTARVWRVADGSGALAWRTSAPVLGVAFSEDGRLVAGGADGLVWSGPIDDLGWVPRDAQERELWVRRLTNAAPSR